MMPPPTNRGTIRTAVGALFAAAALFFQLASPLEAAGDGKVKDLLAGAGENPRNAKLCKTTIPWLITAPIHMVWNREYFNKWFFFPASQCLPNHQVSSPSQSYNIDIQILTLIYSGTRFNNGPCSGDNNLNGTCYTEQECSSRGGVNGGSCAAGFGICCIRKFFTFIDVIFGCSLCLTFS